MNSMHPDLCLNKRKIYQIDVQERLDNSWTDWFDGMEIVANKRSDGSEATTITGEIVDQAALHGVLNRIRDLNLTLLSVQVVSS